MKIPTTIAVVTTCDKDFERYASLYPTDEFVKISTLKDIRQISYVKAVLLIESRNVTDHVIKTIKTLSNKVENLSKRVTYVK